VIEHVTEFKMSQSRGHTLVYRDINDPDFSKDYGAPKDIVPDREVTLEVHLHLVYDKDHAHLVRALTDAVVEINREIERARERVRSS